MTKFSTSICSHSVLGNLRVPGGLTGVLTFILIVVAFFAFSATADEPVTTTHTTVQVYLNGYRSEKAITNPTDEAIEVRRPCPDNQSSCPPITDRIPARSRLLIRQSDPGTDIETTTLDARLQLYAKVWNPYGQFCIIPPLVEHTSTVWFYDLETSDEFENYTWIAVPPGQEGRYITIEDPGVPADNAFARRPVQSYLMGRGAIIERVWGPTVRIHLGGPPNVGPAFPAPNAVYAWSFSTHAASGAITPHISR